MLADDDELNINNAARCCTTLCGPPVVWIVHGCGGQCHHLPPLIATAKKMQVVFASHKNKKDPH